MKTLVLWLPLLALLLLSLQPSDAQRNNRQPRPRCLQNVVLRRCNQLPPNQPRRRFVYNRGNRRCRRLEQGICAASGGFRNMNACKRQCEQNGNGNGNGNRPRRKIPRRECRRYFPNSICDQYLADRQGQRFFFCDGMLYSRENGGRPFRVAFRPNVQQNPQLIVRYSRFIYRFRPRNECHRLRRNGVGNSRPRRGRRNMRGPRGRRNMRGPRGRGNMRGPGGRGRGNPNNGRRNNFG